MSENVNVSVTSIEGGIDYLKEEFMNPLISVGQEIIDGYTELNGSLQSENINQSIHTQQTKLDELQNELNEIIEKARTQMTESSQKIARDQSSIDDDLANV